MSDDAHVGEVVNVKDARDIYFNGRAAPQALHQLPGDIPDFVGRGGLRTDLGAHLRAPAQGQSTGARVALHGPPGVGKSALAIRLAHTVKDEFPNAQLYVNLGAGAGRPLAPTEALAGFLRAFGVEGPYPESEDERATFYRSQLEGERALIVLDNARDLAHIRPLLPGSPTCTVIVTSRRPLGGLEGAFSCKVDVLDLDVAVELLGEIVGSSRVEAEHEAAQRVARLCGELPLAVRIAGGRLKNNPHRTLAWLAGRLEDERRRLDELELEDLAVRASLAVSYEDFAPVEAQLFCLLAALPGLDFSTALAAGADGADTQETERLLDRLVEAQMLEVSGEGRYRFHDLIRLFAGERLDAEPDLDRQAITDQASTWLWEQAEKADRALGADDHRHADALEWLEAERGSLVAAIEASHAASRWNTVLALTFALTDFFSLRSHWDDWTRTHELALDSSRHVDDRRVEGQALNHLAIAYSSQGRWEEAITKYEQALAIRRELKDRRGEVQTLNNLATVCSYQGRWDEAITKYEDALAIYRKLKERRGEGGTLNNLATVYIYQGRWDEAITNYEQALAICRELKDRLGEGRTLDNLAIVYNKLGRPDEAIANGEQALAILRELKDRNGEGQALNNLALVCIDQGHWEEAIAKGEQALAICRELKDRRGEGQTLNNLANVYGKQGRWEEAITNYEQDLAICRELGDRHGEGVTLGNLGMTEWQSGEVVIGERHLRETIELLDALGAPEADQMRAWLAETEDPPAP